MRIGQNSAKSAREPNDGLNVKGLRKQIDKMKLLDPVAAIYQHAQVAGQSGGIARDVNELRGLDPCQLFRNFGTQTRPRRVHQNKIWSA